jgi:hypothetical protein
MDHFLARTRRPDRFYNHRVRTELEKQFHIYAQRNSMSSRATPAEREATRKIVVAIMDRMAQNWRDAKARDYQKRVEILVET